jgi:replicative DNA helicase
MIVEHIQLEQQLIYLLLNDKECVRKWMAIPSRERYFDPSHEIVIKGVIWAFNEDVILTRQSFKVFSELYLKSPSEVAAQMQIFGKASIQVTKPDDFPMLVKRIKDAYIRRKGAEYFREYNKEREKNGDIEANRNLSQKLQTLEADSLETNTSFIDIAANRGEFMKSLLERRSHPASRLTCGIREIDETMGVGFQKGTLTIFCAGPGSYKTTIMMNIALNIWEQSNENVMFLPLEMPYQMMEQKIVSRLSKVPFTKIDRAEQLTDDEIKRIAERMEQLEDKASRFKLLKPGDRAKVSTIRYEIEKRMAYFAPRIVLVDYLDNLVPDTRQSRNDLELRDIFEDLIRMGENLGFAVVTAAKLSRDALKRLREQKDGKKELDSTDVHGGQEFGGNAAFMYGQMKNQKQPTSLLDFFCMKSRYASPFFNGSKTQTCLKIQADIGLIESAEDGIANWEGADNLGKIPRNTDDDQPF